ncbi:MAG: hypothetical protein WA061_03530 [Microgenomates group bacterium]
MKKTIANTISEKIKRGEITMRSQASIWAEKFGLNSGMIILFFLLCTIAGFILYWINSNNDLLFGGYGQYGISSFVQSFPYIFIIGFIVLFIFLIIIFKRFDFSYKKPFSIILFLVVIGALLAGWISIKQPIGQRLYQQEGRMLRMGMMNNSNAISGVVIEINAKTIIIQNEKGVNTTINFSSDTHFPFGQPKTGDSVRVVGTWDESTFNALGIRIFDENNPSTLGPGMMKGRGQGRGRMRSL